MQEKPWTVVSGPEEVLCDVSPDTQLTDPWQLVLRRDGLESGAPGDEIVIYTYAEFNDPNGQKPNGDWPDVVVTAQVGFEIREENGDVNTADYAYVTLKDESGQDQTWKGGFLFDGKHEFADEARQLAVKYAEAAEFFDWNPDAEHPTEAVRRLLGLPR